VTDETEQPRKEPLLNAPWPSIAVVLVILVGFIWQSRHSPIFTDAYALSVPALRAGRWEVLVTHLFLHAGVSHLLVNSGAAIAFGPPVARLLGTGAKGAGLYFTFFLVCGVISAAGFLALHTRDGAAAIGASGAVSGLWGAASRLVAHRGVLSPITSRPVVIQAIVFVAINVGIGVLGGMAGYGIAWEAHLAGYAAGLLLVGPFVRLAGKA